MALSYLEVRASGNPGAVQYRQPLHDLFYRVVSLKIRSSDLADKVHVYHPQKALLGPSNGQRSGH